MDRVEFLLLLLPTHISMIDYTTFLFCSSFEMLIGGGSISIDIEGGGVEGGRASDMH